MRHLFPILSISRKFGEILCFVTEEQRHAGAFDLLIRIRVIDMALVSSSMASEPSLQTHHADGLRHRQGKSYRDAAS